MSGLTVFFREHLASSTNDYATSLLQTSSTSMPSDTNANASNNDSNNNSNNCNNNSNNNDDNNNTINTDNEHHHNDDRPRLCEPSGPSLHAEWKDARKSIFVMYSNLRLLGQRRPRPLEWNAEHSNMDDDNTNEPALQRPRRTLETTTTTTNRETLQDESQTLETQPPPELDMTQPLPETQPRIDEESSQRLETQPPLDEHQQQQSPQQKSSSSSILPPPEEITPTIWDTHHAATHMTDLDLLTSEVTLQDCQIVRIWNVRECRRHTHKTVPHTQLLFPSSMALPRLTWGSYQDDGPLSSCYRHVMTLEVRQQQRRRHRHHPQPPLPPTQAGLRVFLYGAYAQQLSRHLACGNNNIKQKLPLDISLRSIPHKCILPYAYEDWYDAQYLVPYCLAIGDDSPSMKVANTAGPTIVLRFDQEGTAIHLPDGWTLRPCPRRGARLEQQVVDDDDDDDTTAAAAAAEKNNNHDNAIDNDKIVDETDVNVRDVRRPENANDKQNDEPRPPPRVTPVTPPPPVYRSLMELASLYKEAKSEGKECLVNIVAVVVGFKASSKTKRGEFSMNLSLMDQSWTLPNPLSANLFATTVSRLPQVQRAGDVVRVHRIKVQEWNGELQLLGLRLTSYVAFRTQAASATEDNAVEFSVVPSNNTTVKEDDYAIMEQQWEWGQDRLRVAPTIRASNKFELQQMRKLRNSEENEEGGGVRGDVTVMIGAILPLPGNVSVLTPRAFLRVWDGTGLPISDPFPDPSMAMDDPPTEALERIATLCQSLDLEAPKQLTGRVVNVAVWEPQHWELIQNAQLRPGSFIRLRNIQELDMPTGNLNCLMVHSGVSLTPLPDHCFEVSEILRNHHQRAGEPRNPNSGILPLTQEELGVDPPPKQVVESGTLSELLSSWDDGLFTGRVLIKDTIPALDFVQSVEEILSRHPDGHYYYRFAVSIQDHGGTTASAFVLNPVGAFLVGLSADETRERPQPALANLKRTIDDCTVRECEIRSVRYQGARYLLMVSISQ